MLVFNLLLLFWGAALGAGAASFLTVVFKRSQTGENWVIGRSHCDYCRQTLPWWQNLPIISFLLQGGRSQCCKHKLSSGYLIGELLGALLGTGLSWYLQIHL